MENPKHFRIHLNFVIRQDEMRKKSRKFRIAGNRSSDEVAGGADCTDGWIAGWVGGVWAELTLLENESRE